MALPPGALRDDVPAADQCGEPDGAHGGPRSGPCLGPRAGLHQPESQHATFFCPQNPMLNVFFSSLGRGSTQSERSTGGKGRQATQWMLIHLSSTLPEPSGCQKLSRTLCSARGNALWVGGGGCLSQERLTVPRHAFTEETLDSLEFFLTFSPGSQASLFRLGS